MIAAAVLGAVHRRVHRPQGLLDRHRTVDDGDTTGDGEVHGQPVGNKGLVEQPGGMLGNGVGFAFVRDPVAEHDELVASDPGNEVLGGRFPR